MDIITQIAIFYSEIIRLIDEKKKITIEDLENASDSDNIVDYIKTKFGFQNIDSKPENQNLLKEMLENSYISENEAHKYQVSDNGLVYLAAILFNTIRERCFDYKWNYEATLEKLYNIQKKHPELFSDEG